MKLAKNFLLASAALFTAVTAAVADVTIDITGATAFRAASNNAIINLLGGSGVTQYAFVGTQGIGGSNRAIFKGTVPGITGTVTIRTSWSGSAAGVGAVANATPVQLLVESTTVAVGGRNETSPSYTMGVAKFAFSDVAQAATPFTAPALDGTQVGVVPFVFLVNDGAPAGITNVTDQLFAAIYSTGSVPVSMFTGNPADSANGEVVVGTGRNNGSGTRITILAETGYGFDTNLTQYQATVDTANDQIAADSLMLFQNPAIAGDDKTDANFGYSSNSFVRDILSAKTDANYPGVTIFSYLTLSDATAAQTNGARWLTYNGVPYSEANVKNGSYSLWGYQWFYNTSGLTAEETTFKNAFVAGIPAGLQPTAGFAIPTMNVVRSGGDGGQVLAP